MQPRHELVYSFTGRLASLTKTIDFKVDVLLGCEMSCKFVDCCLEVVSHVGERVDDVIHFFTSAMQ